MRCPLWAQFPDSRQLNIDSFEKVWTTIRDKHWEKNPGGLDWQAIHEEFRPRIEKAKNIDEVRTILNEMLGRLHQTHFAILPATVYDEVGPLANAATSGTSLSDAILGDGSPGIDLRMIDASGGDARRTRFARGTRGRKARLDDPERERLRSAGCGPRVDCGYVDSGGHGHASAADAYQRTHRRQDAK